MMQFKSCPRCHGDVQITRDMYGAYKECLQCGFMRDVEEQPTRKLRRLISVMSNKEVA